MEEVKSYHPKRRGWEIISWLSFPAIVAFTLVLIDWRGTGVPKPFVMFFLPALIGIAGGIAGGYAGKSALGVTVGVFGVSAVPLLIMVFTMLFGP